MPPLPTTTAGVVGCDPVWLQYPHGVFPPHELEHGFHHHQPHGLKRPLANRRRNGLPPD